MPIFEYVCKECQHQFEALVYGQQKAACPKCDSKKLEAKLSVFAVSAKGGSPTSSSMPAGPMSAGPCGSCGSPDGPGSCAWKN
jgi:putative FmdB family regulatory protein